MYSAVYRRKHLYLRTAKVRSSFIMSVRRYERNLPPQCLKDLRRWEQEPRYTFDEIMAELGLPDNDSEKRAAKVMFSRTAVEDLERLLSE